MRARAEAVGQQAPQASPFLPGGQQSLRFLPDEGIACSGIPGGQVYRPLLCLAPCCLAGLVFKSTKGMIVGNRLQDCQECDGHLVELGVGCIPCWSRVWPAGWVGLCSKAQSLVVAWSLPGFSGRVSWKQHRCQRVWPRRAATSGQHKPQTLSRPRVPGHTQRGHG